MEYAKFIENTIGNETYLFNAITIELNKEITATEVLELLRLSGEINNHSSELLTSYPNFEESDFKLPYSTYKLSDYSPSGIIKKESGFYEFTFILRLKKDSKSPSEKVTAVTKFMADYFNEKNYDGAIFHLNINDYITTHYKMKEIVNKNDETLFVDDSFPLNYENIFKRPYDFMKFIFGMVTFSDEYPLDYCGTHTHNFDTEKDLSTMTLDIWVGDNKSSLPGKFKLEYQPSTGKLLDFDIDFGNNHVQFQLPHRPYYKGKKFRPLLDKSTLEIKNHVIYAKCYNNKYNEFTYIGTRGMKLKKLNHLINDFSECKAFEEIHIITEEEAKKLFEWDENKDKVKVLQTDQGKVIVKKQ